MGIVCALKKITGGHKTRLQSCIYKKKAKFLTYIISWLDAVVIDPCDIWSHFMF